MAKSNVEINLNSNFDGKGFKAAESASAKLGKTVVHLGTALAGVFAVDKIVQFGKASVEAFSANQKSAAMLTTAVKNLGLAYSQGNIEALVKSLSQSSAIAEKDLRPALQSLLTTTGDYATAQKLLNTAIDVSRGSGQDLATVTNDLSQAYVGNLKGLKKYYLGLSQAQLKAMSFTQILGKMNDQFKGASSAYLQTTAGKMEALKTATDEATIAIGQGLVNAFIALSGSTSTEGAVKKIEAVGTAAGDALAKIGYLGEGLFSSLNPSWSNFLGFSTSDFKKLSALIDKQKQAAAMANALPYDPSNNSVTGYQADKKKAADAKKLADQQALLLKQSTAAQKALTAEQKKQNQLKKDASIFDQQHIELIAALKGQLSDDDRRRAELQLALLDNNVTEADILTKQILMATDATGKLYAYFQQQTPDAKNPFGYLDQWLAEFQKKLAATQFPVPAGISTSPTTGAVIGYTPSTVYPAGPKPGDPNFIGPTIPSTNVPAESMVTYSPSTGLNYNPNAGGGNSVSLTISGDSTLTNAIADAMQNSSLSTGNSTYINRRTGGFE
jgi:hypothetical protein